MSYNIAVVGFGLTGRIAALELSLAHNVTVYEAGNAQALASAGRVAAAMLAPLAESVLCEQDLALMGLDSINRWPQSLPGVLIKGFIYLVKDKSTIRPFILPVLIRSKSDMCSLNWMKKLILRVSSCSSHMII